MRILIISSFFLNLIMGCALGKGVRPAFEQNGRQIYEAKCNGTARSITDCNQQASKQCNGYFKVLTQENRVSGFVPVGNSIMAGVNRTMLFHCLKTPLKVDLKSPSMGE